MATRASGVGVPVVTRTRVLAVMSYERPVSVHAPPAARTLPLADLHIGVVRGHANGTSVAFWAAAGGGPVSPYPSLRSWLVFARGDI